MTITTLLRGNMSRPQFSKKYGIPVRTLEDWDAGKSKAPDYVVNLLARAVYEDITGCHVWFVAFNCTDGSKGTPFREESIMISTKNILEALRACGRSEDKNYHGELWVCTQNPEDEDAENYEYERIEWEEIDRG